MKRRLHQGLRRKMKMSTKLILVAGSVAVSVTLILGWLVFMNLHDLSKTKASGNPNEIGGNSLNTGGEILSEFTWEKDPVTHATLGPDAISAGKTAHSMAGGRASTGGLSAGKKGKDINLVLPETELFDQEGIDISIDYRRNESTGNFYTRGNLFNFGMADGFLTIMYRLENPDGRTEGMKQKTSYEVPMDAAFRTYRFIYTPHTGKAEMFVNSVMVWSAQHPANSKMTWKNSGPVEIGKEMNGSGSDEPVFDNLVIRSTGSAIPLAESLLNFMLEAKSKMVTLHWSTAVNTKADHFTMQRSENGVDFIDLAVVKADPELPDGDEYTYVDKTAPDDGVVYYRIKQVFQNGKFVMHPMSAVRFQSDKGFSIERVNPQPFDKSFDISYFLPRSGRVWIQLSDLSGKVLTSESFDAPRGKNVHVFHDQNNLRKGNYTLLIMFDNKKVSAKVTKG